MRNSGLDVCTDRGLQHHPTPRLALALILQLHPHPTSSLDLLRRGHVASTCTLTPTAHMPHSPSQTLGSHR